MNRGTGLMNDSTATVPLQDTAIQEPSQPRSQSCNPPLDRDCSSPYTGSLLDIEMNVVGGTRIRWNASLRTGVDYVTVEKTQSCSNTAAKARSYD